MSYNDNYGSSTSFTITKSKIIVGVLVVVLVILAALSQKLLETNKKGFVQIKQAALTGTMSVRQTPGTYLQLFGDITPFHKQFTFFFTADSDADDDTEETNTVEVRFADGSLCDMEATNRLGLPIKDQQLIDMVDKESYTSEKDIEQKLVKPWLRKVFRHTANMMTARESYKEKRADFVLWSEGQYEKGLYKTKDVMRPVVDLITGETVDKPFKVILNDSLGQPIIHEPSPLVALGFTIEQFEVKRFGYREKVQEQIKAQQEAIMEVATQQAEAAKAQQITITTEEQGKAAVMKAKYAKEEEKIRAVVDAEKAKEVAELDALRDYEVAKLARKAASETKQKEILLGQGESQRKSMNMKADGALAMKLATYEKVQATIWENVGKYQGAWVSQFNLGGSGGRGNGAQQLVDLLTAKTAQDLSLELSVPKGTTK